MLSLIPKYFPEFTNEVLEKLEFALNLHKEWNEKINLISRKDIENIECHHYLYSLSLIKFIEFKEGMEVLDVGTGGGFPGLPLAIVCSDVRFILLDSIQKKLNVIEDICTKLGLNNVKTVWSRVEDYHEKHDVLTARAVVSLPKFYELIKKNVKKQIVYLKGGEFANELLQLNIPYEVYEIYEKIPEPYFETKKIVSLRFN